tara:strand:- start:73 stop:441 length:369 start_codon:yes stop_codon:yes gene_type:complete
MDKGYEDLIRASNKYKVDKDSKFKEDSKDRLLKISKKKVQTTMIGALSTIEKHFGFLWGYEEEDNLTDEQKHMRDIFEEARSEILDKGNSQIRNLEAEFSQYDIKWLRYSMTLPVKTVDKEK